MPISAVLPASGIAAACSKLRLAGLRSTTSVRAHTYSAKAPSASPYTSSPGWSVVTPGPTASTTPAKSRPPNLGRRAPQAHRHPHHVRVAAHQVPVVRVHRGGPDPDQHLAGGRDRAVDLDAARSTSGGPYRS